MEDGSRPPNPRAAPDLLPPPSALSRAALAAPLHAAVDEGVLETMAALETMAGLREEEGRKKIREEYDVWGPAVRMEWRSGWIDNLLDSPLFGWLNDFANGCLN